MPIVPYTPEMFPRLKQAIASLSPENALHHRPFVDYYYTNNPWCRLYLFVQDDDFISGIVGIEKMRFVTRSGEMITGFGSNYYSFKHGIGGILFMKWMQECPYSLVFGGSPDTHAIVQRMKWTYFTGVKIYLINRRVSHVKQDKFIKKAAKKIYGKVSPHFYRNIEELKSNIPAIDKDLCVTEEKDYSEDMLPEASPFSFRFAPTVDHLRWRYHTGLSFIRYRLYRILSSNKTLGYVILNDSPEQVMVSHCDGLDPRTLAQGALLSLVDCCRDDTRPRQVLLSSSHPDMQKIFEAFGFRSLSKDRPLALGSLKHKIDLSPDTSGWLVNFDWGDNGLRTPFLDQ